MTLTEKEMKSLEILNKKGNFYTFIEVATTDGTMRNKCVKVAEIAKIEMPLKRNNDWLNVTESTLEISSLTMAEIQDADELRRFNARKNNL